MTRWWALGPQWCRRNGKLATAAARTAGDGDPCEGTIYTNSDISLTCNFKHYRQYIKGAMHNNCSTLNYSCLSLTTFQSKCILKCTFASPNAKDSTFALPNARNTNMLVYLALGDPNFLRWPCTFLFLCVDFICVG